MSSGKSGRRAGATQAERITPAQITGGRVLEELARIAFADIRRVGGGGVITPHDLDDDTAAAVQSVKVVECPRNAGGGKSGSVSVKFVRPHDQATVLRALMKHLGHDQGADGDGDPGQERGR